jgi:parallel beta-helix repeat protein
VTGGGISIRGGTAGLFVLNSTISSNTASGAGGGIVFSGAVGSDGFTIRNSTISGNTAGGGGGGLYINSLEFFPPATASVQNSTITNNVATSTTVGGGGIGEAMPNPAILGPAAIFSPTIALQSTIVSGNSNPSGPDIGGSFFASGEAPTVDAGFSAIGSAKGFKLTTKSGNNLPFGTDLRLGPLAYNGGPTQTHALLAGSPAIVAGANPAGLVTDQRGAGFPRVVGAAADIGAYEVPPVIVTSVAVNAGQANLVQRSMVTSLTVTFANSVTFSGAPENAFRLARTSPGGPLGDVTLSVALSGSTATQTIAKLSFSGPLTEGPAGAPSLIDGDYTLTVLSSQINGGVVVGVRTATLFRLFGDVNGDRAVNGLDLAVFRTAFGGSGNYVSYLDVNGDGIINGLDLAVFRARFGTSLP